MTKHGRGTKKKTKEDQKKVEGEKGRISFTGSGGSMVAGRMGGKGVRAANVFERPNLDAGNRTSNRLPTNKGKGRERLGNCDEQANETEVGAVHLSSQRENKRLREPLRVR